MSAPGSAARARGSPAWPRAPARRRGDQASARPDRAQRLTLDLCLEQQHFLSLVEHAVRRAAESTSQRLTVLEQTVPLSGFVVGRSHHLDVLPRSCRVHHNPLSRVSGLIEGHPSSPSARSSLHVSFDWFARELTCGDPEIHEKRPEGSPVPLVQWERSILRAEAWRGEVLEVRSGSTA